MSHEQRTGAVDGVVVQRLVHLEGGQYSGLTTSPVGDPADGPAGLIRAGGRCSFGGYFNAFPAAHWSRFTAASTVRLVVTARGAGVVDVVGSDAGGAARTLATLPLEDEEASIDIPLSDFEGGGMAWFEVAAGGEDVTVLGAEWRVLGAEREDRRAGVGIAIATYNRPAACVTQLRAVAGQIAAGAAVTRVAVVDQGENRLEEAPGFREVAAELGDLLTVVRQDNLGGSGGFTRGILEVLETDCEVVLLLDDDAVPGPEAILRAASFAEFATRPVIVGGGMLHLDRPATLYTQGEHWLPARSWMTTASPDGYDIDLSRGVVEAPGLHRVVEADYTGWWFCLFPREVIARIGLPLPLFLKFDDAEFGLRAREAGIPTIGLPGVAVWHEGWAAKDPTRTWEGFFILRNQVITGLLHSHRRRGGVLPLRTLLGDVQLLLRLQYAAVRLRHEAIRDALRGPQGLAHSIRAGQGAMRALQRTYPDGCVVADEDIEVSPRRSPAARPGAVARFAGLAPELLRHLLVEARTESRRVAEDRVRLGEARWWRFRGLDSALVEAPNAAGWTFAQRDRRRTVEFLARSIRLTWRLSRAWPRLSREYRDALPGLTSAAAWRSVLGEAGDPPR